MEHTPTAHSALPHDLGLLAVDIQGFSKNPSAHQDWLINLIPTVLERAFTRSGLLDVWQGAEVTDSTGDGYIVCFAAVNLPQIVDRFIDELQTVLRDQAPTLRAYDSTLRMRMRLALGCGPTASISDGRIGSPAGEAMMELHRLLDAEPLRRLLEQSDPEVTFVAAILSRRAFDDVVRAGRASYRPSQFAPVRVTVKEYDGAAHVRVPEPSGMLLASGLGGTSQPDDDEDPGGGRHARPPDDAGSVANTLDITGRSEGPVVQAGRIRDLHHGSTGTFGSVRGGTGPIAGRDVDQSNRGPGIAAHGATFHGDVTNAPREHPAGAADTDADQDHDEDRGSERP